MRPAAVLVLALALAGGCGRLGFDPLGGGGDGRVDDAGGAIDASELIDGCVGCPVVCGDGTCNGNGGESCTDCADCQVVDVCGNGACDAGENSDNCLNDCGPSPWTWAAAEEALVTAINEARTGGTMCPGMPVATAPALTPVGGLASVARDLAWEEAHLGTILFENDRCNGDSIDGTLDGVGVSSRHFSVGPTTTQTRLDTIRNEAASCVQMMSTLVSEIGVGIAVDASSTTIVLYR